MVFYTGYFEVFIAISHSASIRIPLNRLDYSNQTDFPLATGPIRAEAVVRPLLLAGYVFFKSALIHPNDLLHGIRRAARQNQKEKILKVRCQRICIRARTRSGFQA